METGRSKELREYLQNKLKLPSALPEPEEEPEFYVEVYAQLNQFQEKLLDALRSAYPDAESLQSLIKQKLGEDFAKITDGKSYALYLQNTIEWMESNGCLLEFIAVAHSSKMQNPKLNYFVRKILLPVLEPLIAPPQVPIAALELPSLTPAPLAKGSNGRTNNHGTEKSNGKTARRKKAASATQSASPEVDQDYAQAQSPPLLHEVLETDNQSHEDLIASARKCTSTAQEKMQSVYERFQKGEKISETWIIVSINTAKEVINGISDIFYHVPIPGSPELDHRFACEEKYICSKISTVLAYALQGTYIGSPSVFQNVDKEFKKIFLGLQNLEDFIVKYEQQIQLSNPADKPLYRSGT